MKSVIAFRDGRRVSLAGAIDPDLYAELERAHSPRKDPALFCGGCGGGIYLRHGIVRRNELFGAHHDSGECADTFIVRASVMSDEHKRMAEYHVLAARAEGLDADMEVTTSGRTRVDVTSSPPPGQPAAHPPGPGLIQGLRYVAGRRAGAPASTGTTSQG